jgi:hypothetical protein
MGKVKKKDKSKNKKEVDGHSDSNVSRLKSSDSTKTAHPTTPHSTTHHQSVTANAERRYNDF